MSEEDGKPIVDLSLKDTISQALEKTNEEAVNQQKKDEVDVRKARRGGPVRVGESDRTNVRILFITSDSDVLVQSDVQQKYADLAQFVGELHIMVLIKGRGEPTVQRPSKNVWLYKVFAGGTLEFMWNARLTARRHLRFSGVVQPDVLVSTDPLQAGLAGWVVSHVLNRPWQVHVMKNYLMPDQVALAKKDKRVSRLDPYIARFVLGRAKSVRGATTLLRDDLAKQFSIEDINVLPHLFNIEQFRSQTDVNLHDTYRQYRFIILAEGEYSAESGLHDVFTATHRLLSNKNIALLIRGSGRAKQLFVKKATLLNVSEQVIFEQPNADSVSRYQGADVFVEASTDTIGDERVLRAIASATPVVAYSNDFRKGIIENGASGFLCEPGDPHELGQRIKALLNDSTRRRQFAMRAKTLIDDQLHEDVPTYYRALRDTITAAITVSEGDDLASHAEETPPASANT